jgi:hypothetical protein
MTIVFTACAIVGSVVLVMQLLFMVVGIGGDHDTDFAGDHDMDFGGDHDMDFAGDHDIGMDGDHDVGHHDVAHTSVFFGVLSFRTLMSALAFFGLAGLASNEAGMHSFVTFVIALAAGAVAMFVVAWLMRLLYGLKSEGNVHVESAVGMPGTVYLSVPGHKEGSGKVTVVVQERTMEYLAMTAKEALPTGTPVVVVGLVGPETVEVAAVAE